MRDYRSTLIFCAFIGSIQNVNALAVCTASPRICSNLLCSPRGSGELPGLLLRFRRPQFKAVITVLPRTPLSFIAGRQRYVHHFAGSDKVEPISPPSLGSLREILQEAPKKLSAHSRPV